MKINLIENYNNTKLIKRILINFNLFKSLKLSIGQSVVLKNKSNSEFFVIGIAWPNELEGVNVYKPLYNQLITNNASDDDIDLITDMNQVKLNEIESVRVKIKLDLDDRQYKLLNSLIKDYLVDLKFIKVGLKIYINFKSKLNEIEVIEINTNLDNKLDSLNLNDKLIAYEFNLNSTVNIDNGGVGSNSQQSSKAKLILPDTTTIIPLGGLDNQLNEILNLINLQLNYTELFKTFNVKPTKGILLFGPPGTGKTSLIRHISNNLSIPILLLNGTDLSSPFHGEPEINLRNVFNHARSLTTYKAIIIVIDEIDSLCPSRESNNNSEVENRVVATLLTELDGIQSTTENTPSIFLIGATNRPNALDNALRRPGRLDREIEIPIPDQLSRYKILKSLINNIPNKITEEELQTISSKSHGFVGADLSSLIQLSSIKAINKLISNTVKSEPNLDYEDVVDNLPNVKPSALRSVQLTIPTTKFSDIAGQDHVKLSLQQSVIWPITHAKTFNRLGLNPPRGVLLYGPPGCSKTLAAKALAGESGINFLAVKGPELLDKFVGGSEKAIRDIFSKARSAAPSIIFFDEIDSIASSRNGDNSSTTSGMVASMLNEMDGIEELNGVTVLAATNKPQVIDPALMRPGRLDRIIYVGPPEYEARKQLFEIHLGKMSTEKSIRLDELAEITDGCSGAEIVSICQDAAMRTMQENLEAQYVKSFHFVEACKNVRRRITKDMLFELENWRDNQNIK